MLCERDSRLVLSLLFCFSLLPLSLSLAPSTHFSLGEGVSQALFSLMSPESPASLSRSTCALLSSSLVACNSIHSDDDETSRERERENRRSLLSLPTYLASLPLLLLLITYDDYSRSWLLLPSPVLSCACCTYFISSLLSSFLLPVTCCDDTLSRRRRLPGTSSLSVARRMPVHLAHQATAADAAARARVRETGGTSSASRLPWKEMRRTNERLEKRACVQANSVSCISRLTDSPLLSLSLSRSPGQLMPLPLWYPNAGEKARGNQGERGRERRRRRQRQRNRRLIVSL